MTDPAALLAAVGVTVLAVETTPTHHVCRIAPLRINAMTFAAKLAKAQADAGLTPTGCTWTAVPGEDYEVVMFRNVQA